MTKLLDGYLKSPLSGITPWILFSVLSTPRHFEIAVCVAWGLALVTMWLGHRRGVGVYALDVLGVAFFAVLAVVGLVASTGTIEFLEVWAGEITNVMLAVFVIATIIMRRPFTLAYAKKQADEEYWDTPLFLKINYVISGVWAGAFVFNAVMGFIGDAVLHDSGNFWTGWVLQLAATFFAIAFTEVYPDHATGDQPASLIKLFEWVPMFVLIAGIFGWVTDALPDIAGIGMIVVGIAGNAVVSKLSPPKQKVES
ncbi:hypothetical protein [Mycolicibacterium mengxianglii]|uniref:hypothetical protein n=1 Tax=Mycolicibacterium mengxianglii TaxID=2736649 RepID=UPI0018D1719B|nr:hypothetical protein [Mycolicibacterium mengxianglii]